MSLEAMAWAIRQNPGSPAKKLLLMVIADAADPDGVTYRGQEALAELCNCTARTIRDQMAALEDAGYIARVRRIRANGSRTSDWTVLAPHGRIDRRGMTDGDPENLPAAVADLARKILPVGRGGNRKPGVIPTGSQTSGPDPSEDPSASLAPASARARPVTYRGRRVPGVIVDEAARLLGVFNEACGRDIGSRTQAGEVSPALKQILGAMMARPGIVPEQWEAAVRNTAANPPRWVEGPLQIGHVFGERAAEHALSNTGRAARTVRDPAKQRRVDDFLGALARLSGRAA